jgi:hypothetical protein
MKRYKLLKNSTRGRKGQIVELQGDVVRQLQANGIIGEPEQPMREPEVKKVVEPKETKGKKRASKATK